MMSDVMASTAPLLGALLAAGVAAGIVAGLFGVGGGIVIVPVLFSVLSAMGFASEAMHVAVGTSLATIVFTSVRSVQAHHKKSAVDWSVLRGWSPAIMIGAAAGAWLAGFVSGKALTVVFGVVAFLVSFEFMLGKPRLRLADELPGGATKAVIGSSIGGLSALMGIGGGTFGVLLMTVCGRPMHQAVGTSAGFGAVIGAPAAIGFILTGLGTTELPPFSLGYVNLAGFVIVSIATFFAAPLGARLAHAMDATMLRRAFGILLALTSLNMLRKALFA